MDLFSRLCGFEAVALARISDPRDRFHLGISSFLSLSGLIACVLSAGYLIWQCTESWLLTFAGSAFTLFSLYALLLVLIASSVLPIFSPDNNLAEGSAPVSNRPRWTRLIIFLLISLSFTQPMAVFLMGNIPYFEKQIDRKIKITQAIISQASIDKMDALLAQREQDLTRLSEMYDRLLLLQYANSEGGLPIPKDTNRKALVIGNANYANKPLQNPTKDAKDLASSLEKMGFNVKVVLDADRLKMEREIDSYTASLTSKDISIFYFSGHGFQEEGNYLNPIGMQTENRSEAVGLNITLEKIKSKHPRANIIIIDACRDFPFGSMKRGGLGDVNIGPNTYIAMAASPGQSAADGPSNTNGLFTGAILHHISKGIDIDLVFRSVREEVFRLSSGRQLPWTSSTLGSELILTAPFKPKIVLSEDFDQLAMVPNTYLLKGLTIDPDLPDIPNAFYCGIVGDPVVDEGVRKRILNCLGQKILRSQDDYKKLTMDVELFKANEQLQNTGSQATRFINIYKILWSDSLFIIGTASLTIILLIILSSGHIMREGFPTALTKYEYSKQYLDRENINTEYSNYFSAWRVLIKKFNNKYKSNRMEEGGGIISYNLPKTAYEDYRQSTLKDDDKNSYQDIDALIRAIKANSKS